MAWRGQGGKRAKGRRGDQDPELDNTAWLAELEREAAARADDDEEDWASTLRGRRSPGPPSPAAADPGWAPSDPAPPPWAPSDPAPSGPAPSPSDYRHLGVDPIPAPGDPIPPPPAPIPAPPDPIPDPADPFPAPPDPIPDPDWSWRPSGPDASGEPAGQVDLGPAGQERYGEPRAAYPDPDPAAFGEPRRDVGAGSDWDGPAADQGGGWRSAGADTPTGTWSPEEPVGREPDYPALFGELYRRSAAQQDPIWEDAPDHPLPEPGQPDPAPSAWPFEETTQSWEPTDRSFIWPSDELPPTSTEWDTPPPRSWLDDPDPQPPGAQAPAPPRPDPVPPPAPDQTAAWPAPDPQAPLWPDPDPAARSSPWAGQPGAGNGVPPSAAGPPPADWAAAIPTDIPAARRAADPSATRMWRPDAADAEPGVPLGGTGAAAGGRPAGPGDGVWTGPTDRGQGGRTPGSPAARADAVPAEEPGEMRREAPPRARRTRPAAGARQARAWPRVVAVISWIVLVMVVCWFYVFPWLERVLPENF
jgi:hypothetical protein